MLKHHVKGCYLIKSISFVRPDTDPHWLNNRCQQLEIPLGFGVLRRRRLVITQRCERLMCNQPFDKKKGLSNKQRKKQAASRHLKLAANSCRTFEDFF